MEDLTQRNFELVEFIGNELTYDHAHLMMSTLGKFHALSFAMKDKEPSRFKRLVEKVPNTFLKSFYDICEPRIYQVLKYNEVDIRKRLMKVFGNSMSATLEKRLNDGAASPYVVFSHGDFKTNNIIFSCDEVV